jgi:hypothetical protein
MNIRNTVSSLPARGRSVSLALAAGALGACSGAYPLGDVSKDDLVDDSYAGASAGGVDALVGPLLAAPDVTFASEGYSLVPLGDLDGDGYGDIAIGAVGLDTLTSLVHVRYGGPRPRTPRERSGFEQEAATLVSTDRPFSLDVVAAGDVDADGFHDFIVRTPECDHTQPGEGAYLIYGGERLEGTRSLASVGAHFRPPPRVGNPSEGLACLFSARSAGPGDLDGDGIDDFVLSSGPQTLQDDSVVFGTGEGIYIFYGRTERFSGELDFSDADALFPVDDQVNPYPAGDLNGDGLADLLIGPNPRPLLSRQPSFALAGRARRWSGSLELASTATPIAGGFPHWQYQQQPAPSDFDGDGLSELLVGNADRDRGLLLFYGGPDVFERGVDPERADAVFSKTNGVAVGDRDGDGDDELINVFRPVAYNPAADVAFASGSRRRFSGEVSFPKAEVIALTPNGRFPADPERVLSQVIPGGDLDGDGTADLFTTSHRVSYSYQISEQQVHIHYGSAAKLASEPR